MIQFLCQIRQREAGTNTYGTHPKETTDISSVVSDVKSATSETETSVFPLFVQYMDR